MKLAPGVLGQLWVVRCLDCKKALPLEGPVTRHGAAMVLDNLQWAEGPRGYLCHDCRSVNPNKR